MKIGYNPRDISDTVRKLVQLAQGRIFFGTPANPSGNCDLDPTVSLVVTTADTNTSTTHQLGRVPAAYLQIRQTAGGQVYDASGGTANWTATALDLRATVPGTYTLMIW